MSSQQGIGAKEALRHVAEATDSLRSCSDCCRLSAFLRTVATEYPDYHCAPVEPFGATRARLLVVGLAPGKHGANRTGRPFTGDHAGILLYHMLHKHGFSNRATAVSAHDGLRLKEARITNAVKCLPPGNKPIGAEVTQCNRWLRKDLQALDERGAVLLTLGRVAHCATLKALGLHLRDYPFIHNQATQVHDRLWLISSYHCSRYNTQTGRLTESMFDAVFAKACAYLRQY
ncbi:MAG: uracil-DNA glycosylase [Candidatus Eutrophobiaceae bacterium]